MNQLRRFLYLFAGLALGLSMGLLIAWGLAPVQYVDTSPASLRIDFKDDYRYMIASAYNATGDLPRAQARLNVIGDSDTVKALSEQAQRMLANNASLQFVQVLANLSEALQTRNAAVPSAVSTLATLDLPEQPAVVFSPTPPDDPLPATPTQSASTGTSTAEPRLTPVQTETVIPTPINTLAPRPKPTATLTAGPAFKLIQQAGVCEASQPGLLQIYIYSPAGKPVPGIELIITWFGGEEHFFSGLKAEISPGYADYTMSESTEYDLSISAGGTRITGLRPPTCTDTSGAVYPGGIRLEFKQP